MDTPSKTEPLTTDGWLSLLTGLGNPNRDKAEFFGFAGRTRLSFKLLDFLYRQDPIAARMVDVPVDDMTRSGFELMFSGTDEEGDGVDLDTINEFRDSVVEWKKQIGVKRTIKRSLKQARAFGGSLIILGIDDGQDDMELPLNEESIRSFDWMYAVDRFQVSNGPIITDPSDPNFGFPEWYHVSSAFGVSIAPNAEANSVELTNIRIHHTRVIRTDGIVLSDRSRLDNDGWGDSVLDRAFEPLRNFNAGMKGSATLIHDFAQGIYKLKGLREILASNKEDLIRKRFAVIDMAKSVINATVLDADGEDYERKSTTVAGLPDLMDRHALHMTAASGMPLTLLMGVSPGGFGTGQAEGENWDDVVSAMQEEKLRPILDRMLTLLFASSDFPDAPGAWSIKFNPLVQPSENEEAGRRKLVAEADAIYINTGVLSPAEVTNSRFGGDAYSAETTLDKESRDEMETIEEEVPDAEEIGAEPVDGETGGEAEKAQDAALNGSQISSLLQIVTAVNEGTIPRDAGVNIIARSFLMTPEQADVLMASAGTEEAKPEPEPEPAPFPPGGDLPDESGESSQAESEQEPAGDVEGEGDAMDGE